MMTTQRSSEQEPLLDLQRLVVGIRWRRRMWTSIALFGMITGALLVILTPAPPTAVTTLLIVHENDSPSDSGNLMSTDVALLETSRIAADAIRRIGSGERPDALLGSYEGVGLTNNVLQLTVRGSNERQALARADALSQAFIADHVKRTQDAADAEAQALVERRDQAEAELAKVDNAIADASARGATGAQAAGLDTLYSRRAELATQMQQFTERAEEVGGGSPRVAAGTQIVDAPRIVGSSALMTGAMNALVGLVLGLAAGLGLAAVASVVQDRPVLRRDIAEHLGASVIAQLSAPGRGLARLWRSRGEVEARKRLATSLARMIRGGHGAISLLELGAKRTTAQLAVDIAGKLSADPVSVADNLPGGHLRKLAKPKSPIRILDGADGESPMALGGHHIGVGSVAPGTAWLELPHLGVETVLVVRAGHANAQWLHTVARQLAAARIPIIGVVLVDPDPRDHSDGTLWDGLRTALRGRTAPHESSPAQMAARPAQSPAIAPVRVDVP